MTTTEQSTQTLQIEGMHCGSCVGRVEKALRSVAGVNSAAVNLTSGLATVQTTAVSDVVALLKAVHDAGYRAIPLRDVSATTLQEVAQRSADAEDRVRLRLIVGLIFGVPLVILCMLPMAGMSGGSAVAEFILATLVMAITGWPYFARGIPALILARPDMDTLVALGSGTAYIASIPGSISAVIHGMTGHPVFDEYHAAVTIVLLVTLGKYLEARARKRAGSAVGSLAVKTNPEATLLAPDGSTSRVQAEAIAVGDRVQIAGQELVPVDGEVIEGSGSVDQSVLTGESVPVCIGVGATVAGGAKLADGRIVIRATATAAHSTIARITELVQQAQASRTNIQRLADRVAGIFVPIVLALAILTFGGWMLYSRDPSQALLAAVATVVIACPCAMGLATPTAITVAMGRGAKLGILFTKAAALETARTIDTVLFDKTGTLTHGQLEVAEVVPLGADEQTVLSLAATLEQYSQHPIARSIVRHAREKAIAFGSAQGFSSVSGSGLRGRVAPTQGAIKTVASEAAVAAPGRGLIGLRVLQAPAEAPTTEILAGSPAFMLSHNVVVKGAAADRMQQEGMTVVAIASDGELFGLIGLRDALRADAAATIGQLRQRGITVGVISGDTEEAVRGVLGDISIDRITAGVRPEGKAKIITELRSTGRRVAFIGDGTNDAPALAAADLGIALAGGTDLARAAGDVILVSPRLSAVPQTLALADATLRIIKQNLAWAFGYNVLAIPLAVFSVVPPGIAAGAMMLSSISVVLNALRLNRAA